MTHPTAETVHTCPHCEEEIGVADYFGLGPPAYECGACGSQFTSEDGNRCPDCNRFAAKLADASCPECEEPIGGEHGDVEEREVYRSADGETHDTADAAAAWDEPAAVAERQRESAASAASAYAVIEQHRRESDARTARLQAALALPTTPPIAYYAGQQPLNAFGTIPSLTAYLTPAEFLACCGAGDYAGAAARCAELGERCPPEMAFDAVRFGVDVAMLCTLLEALAEEPAR